MMRRNSRKPAPLLATSESMAAGPPLPPSVVRIPTKAAVLLLPALASKLLPPAAAMMHKLPATHQDRVGRAATAAAAAAARAPPTNTLLAAGIPIETAALASSAAASGAAAADATVVAGNRFSHARGLLSDASLTDTSAPDVTVTASTPEAVNTGTFTLTAPNADTVKGHVTILFRRSTYVRRWVLLTSRDPFISTC